MDSAHGGSPPARLEFPADIPLAVLPAPLIPLRHAPRQPPEISSDSPHFRLRYYLLGLPFYGYYNASTARLPSRQLLFKAPAGPLRPAPFDP